MATRYVVKQGDHMTRIASRFGFLTFWPIWDHPDNAGLRELRTNPHVLLPGDVVVVPDRTQKSVSLATGRRHVFQLDGAKLSLRIALLDYGFRPTPALDCELHVDGIANARTTDSQGLIAKPIPASSEHGRLLVYETVLPLFIGHLDPVSALSGARARLNNLGYEAGESDDPTDAQLRSALEEFQCDHAAPIDGEMNPVTQGLLLQLHGS